MNTDKKKSKPLISIVIPTFNSGKTLETCLDSIQAQTFRDFELLIIDSVSSDNTLEIINKFKDRISIHVLSEKDNGIYDAMNKGIQIASGLWIYFLGSDDTLFESDILMKVANVLKSTDSEVVYGNVMSERFSGIYAGEFDDRKIFNSNICHQSVFFKKTVFHKTGKFDIRYKSQADYEHNFRWFLSQKIKHSYVNLVIANYADGGLSSLGEDEEFLKVKRWKYCFLTRKKIGGRQKIKILRQELYLARKQGRTQDYFEMLLNTPRFILNL